MSAAPPSVGRGTIRSVVATVLILAVCAGCAGPGTMPLENPGPQAPEQVARSLFQLGADPEPEQLERLFGERFEGDDLADLLDALDALPRETPVELVGTEPIGFDGAVVYDFDLGREPSGLDRCSVQLMPAGEAWHVVWFQGPGIGWPPQREPREATSSSAAPEDR